MKKIQFIFLLVIALALSGCNGQSNDQVTGIFKSSDSGKTWETKNQAPEEKTISGTNILSLAMSRQESGVLYIGTAESGIFKTTNSGDLWDQVKFPPIKVYGLLIDPTNSSTIYASGVWNKRGKIYKSQNGGTDWDEIYTEPVDNTVIISMAFSPTSSGEIFAGISNGIMIRSTDGGTTWQNVYSSKDPIISITSQPNSSVIYADLNHKKLIKSEDSGNSWQEIKLTISSDNEENPANRASRPTSITALALDPSNNSRIYAATNQGLLVSNDNGSTWSSISILSSKDIPINAVAINPSNPSEIIYVSSQAIYRSINSGNNWSTFQFSSPNRIRNIYFNPSNTSEIYAIFSKNTQKSSLFSL